MKHTKEIYDLFEVTGINGHNEDSKIAIKGSQLEYFGNDTDLVIIVDGLLDDLAPLLNAQFLEALKDMRAVALATMTGRSGGFDYKELYHELDRAIKKAES